MKIQKALSYDDVLLVPRKSNILPKETDVSTKVTKRISIKIPIISSPMDTVTEYKMAITMAREGGVGIIHKNMPVPKQVAQVKMVKKEGLIVGAAISVGDKEFERALKLVDAGVDIIVIDTAHGHSQGVIDQVKRIKKTKLFKNIDVVAGNIATSQGAYDLIKCGADAVKVGVGPGSICTTRVVTGVGVPQITAILNAVKGRDRAKKISVPIIADGGINYSGDIAKALAAGADCVMIGSLLAGTDESPGRVFKGKYKIYRGMGSLEAMNRGSKDRYGQSNIEFNKLVPEGISGIVPYRGSVSSNIFQLVGGLRSAMGYIGAKTIYEMQKRAKFVELTSQGLKESHPHNLLKLKDTTNYKLS